MNNGALNTKYFWKWLLFWISNISNISTNKCI